MNQSHPERNLSYNIAKAWAFFNLPFLVEVKDNFDEQNRAINSYTVTIAGATAEILFKRETRTLNGLDKGLKVSKDSRLVDDASKTSFSVACVVFNADILQSIGIKTGLDLMNDTFPVPKSRFRNTILRYLNRFLEIYSYVTKKYFIQPISVYDLSGTGMRIHWKYENGAEEQSYQPFQKFLEVGTSLTTIEDSQDREIREILGKGGKVNPLFLLEMDIEYKIKKGESELAIIQMGTYFEAVVTDYLKKKLKEVGKTEAEIEGELLNEKGEPLWLNSKLKKLSDLIGKNFKKGIPEYDAWYANAQKVRNDLVHGTRLEVTERELMNAANAVKQAIKYLTR